MRIFDRLRQMLASTPKAVDAASDVALRMVAENSADVIIRLGSDRRIKYISPSAIEVFGRPASELIGLQPDQIIMGDDLHIIADEAARHARGEKMTPHQVRALRPDGRLTWVEGRASPVPSQDGGTPEIVLIVREITERKLRDERLSILAMEDGLTGLANRRAFDQALARDWDNTVRDASEMSLLLLDIDHFKQFNDLYGHQVGDDCLRAVASAVKSCVERAGDLVARYGGEEIAVILPNCDAASAIEIAERARQAIGELKIAHEGENSRSVTVSIGVATALSRPGGTIRMPETLLHAADTALYKAKANGRDRIETGLVIAPSEMPPADGR